MSAADLADIRARWDQIVPRGPVEYQSGQQLSKADVVALLAHADALAEENTRLRAALAEAEARAARAPVADDYPAEVFRELRRVLKELRAATGEEGRA